MNRSNLPPSKAAPRYATSDESDCVDSDDLVQLCSFRVGAESYVLDIMRIKEILNPLPVTPIRRGSRVIEGVIDLRGEVIPVVDLRCLLGVPSDVCSRVTKQIIASVNGELVGLVVDAMGRVIVVPRSTIRPLPMLTAEEARLFPGLVNHQGQMHLLLNIKALLGDGIVPSEVLSTLRSLLTEGSR